MNRFLILLFLMLLSVSALGQSNMELGYHFPYILEEGETYPISISEDEQREVEILSNRNDVANVNFGGSNYEIKSLNSTHKDAARKGESIVATWKGQKVVEKTDDYVVMMGKCGSNGFFFNKVDRELRSELADEPKPTAFKLKVSTENSPYPKCNKAFDMFASWKENGIKQSSNRIFINPKTSINSPIYHSLDPDLDGKFEDVNGDGALNDEDVRIFFENIDSLDYDNFDFNEDGNVNVADVSKLRKLSRLEYEGIKRDDSEVADFEFSSKSKLVKVRRGPNVTSYNLSMRPQIIHRDGYRIVINNTWLSKVNSYGKLKETSYFNIGDNYAAKILSSPLSSHVARVDITSSNKVDVKGFPEIKLEKEYSSNSGYPSEKSNFRIGGKVINISFSSSGIDSEVLINGKRKFEPCQEKAGLFKGYDDRLYSIGEYSVRFEENCDFSGGFARERLNVNVAKDIHLHSVSPKGRKTIDHVEEVLVEEGGRYEFTSGPSVNVNTPHIDVKSIDDEQVALNYQGFRSIVQSRIECRFKGEVTLSDGDILNMQKKIGRGEDLLYRVRIQNTEEGIHKARFVPILDAEESGLVTPPETGCEDNSENPGDRSPQEDKPSEEQGPNSKDPRLAFAIDLGFEEEIDNDEELKVGDTVAVTTDNINVPPGAEFNGKVIGPSGDTLVNEGRTFSFVGTESGNYKIRVKVVSEDNSESKVKNLKFSKKSRPNNQKNSVTVQAKNPVIGKQTNIQIKTKQNVAEKGYLVIIENPESKTVQENEGTKTTKKISFTPQKSGDYTIKILPQVLGQNVPILGDILQDGSITQNTITVSSPVQEGWKVYCKDQTYDTESLKGKISCIKQAIIPEYFEDSTGSSPEVAESLCQDLLGYNYNIEQSSCVNS